MIKMATKDLTAGMVTAAPVYSKTGQRLFDANTMLTSQKISYLEFYGVEWVQVLPEAEIEEPEIPDAPEPDSSQAPKPAADTVSYSQKVKRSKNFHIFKVDYSKKTKMLEDSFSHLIDKSQPFEPDALLEQISSLYSNHLTSGR